MVGGGERVQERAGSDRECAKGPKKVKKKKTKKTSEAERQRIRLPVRRMLQNLPPQRHQQILLLLFFFP